MTDKQVSIVVELEDKVSSSLKTIKSNIASIDGSGFSKLDQSVQNTSTSVGFLKNTLVGLAAGVSVGSIISEFTRLEDSINSLTKVSDFEFAQKASKELAVVAKELGKTQAELVEVATRGIAVGIDQKDIVEFSKQVSKGVVAMDEFRGRGEELSNGLASIQKQYGLTVEEGNNYLSMINSVGDSSQATSSDILQFTVRNAALAKELGITVAEAGAVGATFVDLGFGIEESSTALKSITVNLANTADVATRLSKVNPALSFSDLSSELSDLQKNDPTGYLKRVLGLINELPRDVKTTFTQEIFGLNSLVPISALSDNLGLLQTQIDASTKSFNEGVSIEKEYAIQSESLTSTIERLKAKFVEIATSIGTLLAPILKALEPVLVGIGNTISFVISVINQFISSPVGQFLKEFTINFLELVGAIGKIISPLVGAGVAIGVLINVVRALSLAVSANPIVASILAIIAVISLLKTAWEENFLGIQNIVAGFSSFFISAFEAIKSFVFLVFQEIYDFIFGKIQGIYDFIKTTFDVLTALFIAVFTAIGEIVSTDLTDVYNVVIDIFTKIKDFIEIGRAHV